MSEFKIYDFEKKVKEVSLKWELTDEDKIIIRDKLRRMPSFSRVFNPAYNLTNDFKDYILKYGNARTDHFIITIKGRTGSGKSSIGGVMLQWLYEKDLNVENVCFSHGEQKKLLKSAGKNVTIMRDEQTNRLGLGSKMEGMEIQTWDETLRKDGINFIYIAPTDRFHGTAHKNLEFVAKNKRARVSLFALYQGLERAKIYTGYVLFRVPTIKQWHNNFWMKYQRKKDKFNLKTREDKHGIDWKQYIDEVKEHKAWNKHISFNDLKAIITDCFIFYPSQFRDTILTMYLHRVGIKKRKRKIVKPEKCTACDSTYLRYYPSDEVWKCRKCYNEMREGE